MTTTTYPACSVHAEHDVDCRPCYLRYEHVENQQSPTATGHVIHFISACPDCQESAVVDDRPCPSNYFGEHCGCHDNGAACCKCEPGPESVGELMQGEPPEGDDEVLGVIARRAFRLSQAIETPDSLRTERGLWAIHEAHEDLKDALRQAGYYGEQYRRRS